MGGTRSKFVFPDSNHLLQAVSHACFRMFYKTSGRQQPEFELPNGLGVMSYVVLN